MKDGANQGKQPRLANFPPRSEKPKQAEPCRNFSKNGSCRRGASCPFLHGSTTGAAVAANNMSEGSSPVEATQQVGANALGLKLLSAIRSPESPSKELPSPVGRPAGSSSTAPDSGSKPGTSSTGSASGSLSPTVPQSQQSKESMLKGMLFGQRPAAVSPPPTSGATIPFGMLAESAPATAPARPPPSTSSVTPPQAATVATKPPMLSQTIAPSAPRALPAPSAPPALPAPSAPPALPAPSAPPALPAPATAIPAAPTPSTRVDPWVTSNALWNAGPPGLVLQSAASTPSHPASGSSLPSSLLPLSTTDGSSAAVAAFLSPSRGAGSGPLLMSSFMSPYMARAEPDVAWKDDDARGGASDFGLTLSTMMNALNMDESQQTLVTSSQGLFQALNAPAQQQQPIGRLTQGMHPLTNQPPRVADPIQQQPAPMSLLLTQHLTAPFGPPPGFRPVANPVAPPQAPPAAAVQTNMTSPSPTNHSTTATTPSTDKQKSNAIMSLLKSRQGDMMVKLRLPGPVAATAAPAAVEETADTAADAEGEGAAIAAGAPAAAKKPVAMRTVRHQVARLFIKVKNYKTGEESRVPPGYYFRPGNLMTVEWRMPVTALEPFLPASSGPGSKQKNSTLVLGLLRYGTATNASCLVNKTLSLTNRQIYVDPATGQQWATGLIQYYAPKSAGTFVYRLFDQATKETIVDTLGTSAPYSVVLIDQDIVSNLTLVLESMNEKLWSKAVAQFMQVIKGIKSCTAAVHRETSQIVNRCVDQLLDEVNRSLSVLDEGQEKKKAQQSLRQQQQVQDPDATFIEDDDNADKDFWQNYRTAVKLHAETFDAFSALYQHKTAWYLVSETLKNTIIYMQRLFCPVLKRYFANAAALQRERLQSLGFQPAAAETLTVTGALGGTSSSLPVPVSQALDQAIYALLPRLLPKMESASRREQLRAQIERHLLSSDILPVGTQLHLYGSSVNQFGNDDADMDMCLIFPRSFTIPSTTDEAGVEWKTQLLTQVGAELMNLGMTDVSSRPTARIPIIEFHDPLSGMDGDISLHNALAVANTQLLRVYSEIDPRVRALAYILKHWAKQRHLNSPQDGTLSSYGYVLSLVHFLQHRPVPMLPSLQNTSPDWRGGPSLQQLVYQQQQQQQQLQTNGRAPVPALPQLWERNSAEQQPCDVYFLRPTVAQLDLMRRGAAENTESVSQLLLEYFRYYAWQFDFRHDVVSIRKPGASVHKIDKYEEAGWFHTDVWSIEDPFETTYDVAHVLRGAQMQYLRKELLRAFTLLTRTVPVPVSVTAAPSSGDGLPTQIAPAQALEALCAACDPPAFVGKRRTWSTANAPASASSAAAAAGAGGDSADDVTNKTQDA